MTVCDFRALLLGGLLLLPTAVGAQSPPPSPAAAPPAGSASDQEAAEPKQVEASPSEDTDISGTEEFVRYCSVCHGLDAKGKGPLAPSLKKPPADLTQITRRNNGHFPFSRIAKIIRDGGEIASHGSSDMPAWGEVFRDHVDPIMSRALIFELTSYLETLQEK
ncbi:MAG: c-type cytochrome [Hyphomicrobiaceae bacterium]|nr:c-type cytochrome [Hyphomicrobiaceae bacterium]